MTTKQLQKLVNSLPNLIRITKDVTYEVVYIDEFSDKRTLGECRPSTRQIVINKNQSNTGKLRTVLHEVIHAVAIENDIELTESQVLGLEDGFFRVLKLNEVLK